MQLGNLKKRVKNYLDTSNCLTLAPTALIEFRRVIQRGLENLSC